MSLWELLARATPVVLDLCAVLVYPRAHEWMAARFAEKRPGNALILVGLYALFALACYALRKLGSLRAADDAGGTGRTLVERIAHSPAIALLFVGFGLATMLFAIDLSGGGQEAVRAIERPTPGGGSELTWWGGGIVLGLFALLFAPMAINVVDVEPTVPAGTPRYVLTEAAALVAVNLMILATEACFEVTFTPAKPPAEPPSLGAGMLIYVPLLLLCYAGPRVVLFRTAPHPESLVSFLLAIGFFARRLVLAGAG